MTNPARTHFERIIESPRDQWPALVAAIPDPHLRRDVQALLDAHANAGAINFMSSPTGPSAVATTNLVPITERPGTRIGPYKLLEEIGEGGFGVVFMAEQTAPIRRRVALKVIKLGMDSRQIVARFEQERQALALMDHPHIARVLDGGTTDSGRPYFVMEYVKGDPITPFAAAHKLSIRQRLDLFTQVCQAVQHAHHKGIIHRDLKPGNVLVSMTDGKPFAKVIDFGIAKATGAALTDKTLFTEHRQLIGTPEYMSPEQAEGSPDIDTRADVYALGVLLYELLTGLTPFDGRRLRSAAYAEMQRIIREEDPPAPSLRLERSLKVLAGVHAQMELASPMAPPAPMEPPAQAGGSEPTPNSPPPSTPNTPSDPTARVGGSGTLLTPRELAGELDWIVMKALDKDRARRYDTPNQLAADVQRHLAGEAVQAAPPSMGYRLRKFVRRNKGPILLASTIAAVVIVASMAVVVFARETHRQATIAKNNADEATNQARLAQANAAEAAKQAGLVLDAAAFAECANYYAVEGIVTILKVPTPAAVRHMSRLTGFKTITFINEREVINQALRVLADPATEFKALNWMDLNDLNVTDAGLQELTRADTGLKSLTGLYLGSTKVTDAGLKELARADTGLKALTELYLSNTVVTDAGLKELTRADTGLKSLTGLYLGSTKVTDAGLKELTRADTGLKALTLLDLNYTAVTDAGVKELASADTGLKALTSLDLWNTNVTDAGLQELARVDTGLRALTTLNLRDTNVTDEGVKDLARSETGVKFLKSLNLQNTKVTDAGLKELSRPDTGLKSLTELNVYHTAVTEVGVDAIKARFPDIKIER